MLAEGAMEAGEHQWTWRAVDEAGRPLPSGVYLLELSGEGIRRSSKLVLIR